MEIKFANNASTTLLDNIGTDVVTIAVSPDTGDLFPDLIQATDYFKITVKNPGDGSWEIMKVTAKDGDLFTVERAQEGTTALAFPQNSVVENRLTAGSIEHILNDVAATETTPGRIRRASGAEVINGTATDAAVTPATLDFVIPIVGTVIAFAGQVDDDGFPINPKTGVALTAWHICDGTHGTIDLRDKFIAGAGTNYRINTTGGTETVDLSFTTNGTALSVDQIPAHTHALSGYSRWVYREDGDDKGLYAPSRNTGETVTTSVGGNQPHTHTVTTTTKAVPPYFALYYIQRIR